MVGKGKQSGLDVVTDPADIRKISIMLLALEDEQNLDGWSMGFVASVGTKFDNGGKLTVTQFEKLEEIYRKFN